MGQTKGCAALCFFKPYIACTGNAEILDQDTEICAIQTHFKQNLTLAVQIVGYFRGPLSDSR